MAADNNLDLSVVTIVYNERGNICRLIEHLFNIFKKHNLKGEVVIVDDSSPDGTAHHVRKMMRFYKTINLIVRPVKSGIASAYRDGINAVKGDIIIAMDADFSHPPSKVFDLYEAAKLNKVAFGSRYTGRKIFETDLIHYIGTAILNLYIGLVLKTGIRDNTNGYFAVKSSILKKLREYTHRHNIDPFDRVLWGITIAAAAKKLGIPAIEIEAPYRKRDYGETKIPFYDGLKIVLSDMLFAIKLKNTILKK